ncbi:RNA polymerase sigma factor [Chitinophaga tropicalis]|uniref:Sigma-70 family RNA polymerase sigma factor n=1 Tax=Chitinophaga tropicalis TaxID=2683588 RepID=A0A7K1U654_9BACT|nr:sigma-70 family RNA polymerase sigma factor [Chitinophaga tropicalis]MVT09837.1 sigma-70 family RNA polymerase sigma factor [Chitinophaga tropicalis]
MQKYESDCHQPDCLWKRFREGDTQAFEQLMKRYYTDLFNYGARFTGDANLVKDCIQDIFLLLWNKRHTIGDVQYVKTYLLTALRRKLKKEKEKLRIQYVEDPFIFESGFDAPLTAEQQMMMEEQLKEKILSVRRVLSQLTARQQEIIYLRFYMEREMTDIADIMMLNRQSVYNLLHDALKRCKAICGQMELVPGLSMAAFVFIPLIF